MQEIEKSAEEFSHLAPLGSWKDYAEIYSELSASLVKFYLHNDDYEAAKRIHSRWMSVDPAEAAMN